MYNLILIQRIHVSQAVLLCQSYMLNKSAVIYTISKSQFMYLTLVLENSCYIHYLSVITHESVINHIQQLIMHEEAQKKKFIFSQKSRLESVVCLKSFMTPKTDAFLYPYMQEQYDELEFSFTLLFSGIAIRQNSFFVFFFSCCFLVLQSDKIPSFLSFSSSSSFLGC